MDDCRLAGNGKKCHGFLLLLFFFTVRIKIFESNAFIWDKKFLAVINKLL